MTAAGLHTLGRWTTDRALATAYAVLSLEIIYRGL